MKSHAELIRWARQQAASRPYAAKPSGFLSDLAALLTLGIEEEEALKIISRDHAALVAYLIPRPSRPNLSTVLRVGEILSLSGKLREAETAAAALQWRWHRAKWARP